MSGVMASVDQRTQLADRTRLELLMFRLDGDQLYGINVFKVREVDRIVNLNWKDILSPPSGTSAGASYLTAVTHVDERGVQPEHGRPRWRQQVYRQVRSGYPCRSGHSGNPGTILKQAATCLPVLPLCRPRTPGSSTKLLI